MAGPNADQHGDTITGRCLCGGVKASAIQKPKWIAHCHCPSCRKVTASAFATYVGFDRAAVQITGDSLTTHSSSPGVKRHFCRICGSGVAFEGEAWPGEIHFHIGFMDEPEAFKPESHVFTRTELPWLHMEDGLPREDGFST